MRECGGRSVCAGGADDCRCGLRGRLHVVTRSMAWVSAGLRAGWVCCMHVCCDAVRLYWAPKVA